MSSGQLDFDDTYYDHRPGKVKLPHDPMTKKPEDLEKLSGPCITIVPAKEKAPE